ncbi:HAD family hydrolase [Catenisphaera adipataccumulans]|jgi:Cof subfamily protein (haloacid dehalogenase superfamily)|uniref:Uncharacterized protein n=1 Tax=Catenisphaera adipataccumulans TaxID=700500 RepID=A0A7W8FV83_9FIRM|nr:HAD family hydrolase [Catenisphaera adipataccumulans]MBB5183369.1 hypothetical protein [Catenisphaera adipataccumulans]
MKSIVFLDIDGTLSLYEKIPPSALEAIRIARQNGHKVFINTGRVRSEMREMMDLDLDGFCLSAGTEIWIGGRRLLYHPMKDSIAKQIQEHIYSLHFGYTMEGSRISFTDSINRRLFKKLYQQDTRQILFHRRSLFPSVTDMQEEDFRQIMKVQINYYGILKPEVILDSLPKHLIWTTYSNTGGEITDSHYSKGTAIDFVKNYYGGNYRTISAGDSDNDISMLKASDESIGMGNATQSVKQIVTYVTDDVRNAGLYNAFAHFGLLD